MANSYVRTWEPYVIERYHLASSFSSWTWQYATWSYSPKLCPMHWRDRIEDWSWVEHITLTRRWRRCHCADHFLQSSHTCNFLSCVQNQTEFLTVHESSRSNQRPNLVALILIQLQQIRARTCRNGPHKRSDMQNGTYWPLLLVDAVKGTRKIKSRE